MRSAPWLTMWMTPMQQHLAFLGLTQAREVTWGLDPTVHDTERHFAVTEAMASSAPRILIAPELRELPDETIQAILMHEWGHAMDFAYPAMLQVGGPLHWGWWHPDARRLEQWKARDNFAIEKTADLLVLGFWGVELRYSGSLTLQGWSGVLRPRDLR